MKFYVADITIAAAGTPQQLAIPTGASPAGVFSKISFQPFPGNTGLAYIGLSGLVKATQANVLWTMPARGASDPTSDIFGPEDQGGRNTIDCTQFWLDAAVTAEKIKVIFTES